MKPKLTNEFRSPLKVAHKNLPAIPEGREGFQPRKLNPPKFDTALVDCNNRFIWMSGVRRVL